MLFNSTEFVCFLPLVFAVYWLLASRPRMQNLFVVVASYVFYGWWDWCFLVLIAFTSGWSYAVGLMELSRWKSRPSKALLAVSLVLNLGILAFFKYCNFFVGQAVVLLEALGFQPHVASLQIVLPVGISFYTFQALSYTIDVYRRRIRPTRDALAFFAFISFFPQLVAGPIERATNLLPQFLSPRMFNYPLAVIGCRQMLWGFFKKMVVADNCAVVANHLLNDPLRHNGLGVWVGVLFFSIQIYGDFSGYSDIAIGCGRLFGFNLMRNFAFPYFARDIAEFWRRWHISLTTWFRDYLYIPLGGSHCSMLCQVRNTFVIFLVSGFWHGANWTFICWGAFHAALFLPLLLGGRNRLHLDQVASSGALPSLREVCEMMTTFFLSVVGWTFFRAQSMNQCLTWFREMISPWTWGVLVDLPHEFWQAFGAAIALLAAEWFNRREQFGFARYPRWTWLRWAIYLLLVGFIVIYTPGGQSFIYFQF